MPFILAGSSLRVGLVAGDSILATADSPANVTFVIGGAAIPGVNKPGMDSRALYYGPLLAAAEVIIAAVVSTDYEVVRGLYAQVETGMVVTLTAAEISAPQPGILADTSATYKLNVAPFTRYRSDGTSLVSVGSGVGGSTNLSYTANASNGMVLSDTGTDATLPVADTNIAGLMTPAQVSKLAGIEVGAQADMTAAELRAAIGTATTTLAGLVPATGSSNTTDFLRRDMTFAAPPGGGVGGTWGSITGTLSNQGDLQAELHANASYITANSMAALVIDTTKALNTKALAVSSTLTFSAQPPQAHTLFGLSAVNTSGGDITVTIPASRSLAQQAVITSFVMPAGSVIDVVWRWDGTTYHLSGEPVQQKFQFSWTLIGTTTARDYPVVLKNTRPFVITALVTKCASGTATATGKIDGVALGGTANAVSATEVEQAHATANTAALNTDFAIGFTAGAVDPQVSGSGYYL